MLIFLNYYCKEWSRILGTLDHLYALSLVISIERMDKYYKFAFGWNINLCWKKTAHEPVLCHTVSFVCFSVLVFLSSKMLVCYYINTFSCVIQTFKRNSCVLQGQWVSQIHLCFEGTCRVLFIFLFIL